MLSQFILIGIKQVGRKFVGIRTIEYVGLTPNRLYNEQRQNQANTKESDHKAVWYFYNKDIHFSW